ncbi:MAG: ATP-binding cassette domain-containing protein [Alphaproteobacteria bacterium]|nr:ATP-binding cassette domain-containing protein [Alphaproteobacteria bacterium]
MLTPSPAAALSIEALGHAFGPKRVLNGVSFALMPGDFTVLLGLNGAGKTTLFSLATGLYAAREGTIRVFGIDLRAHASECLRRMGVVFQQPTLDLDLSVEQNLFYHAALHGLSRREAADRAAAEAERVGLGRERLAKARRLSGGQRRRIEIARSLMHRPRLLLLDEPTVGLDIASRQFLLDHVRRLCREEGIAALWATHLIDEVGDGARVVVLHKGEVLAAGAAAQLVYETRAASMRAAFETLVREREAA